MHIVLTKPCAMPNARAMLNPLEHLKPSGETCSALKIDRSTLSRWVAAGKITPAFRLPGPTGAMYFYPADVEALRASVQAKRDSTVTAA